MNFGIPTERVFSLSAFEGVRLLRGYAVRHPDLPTPEVLALIERLEPDGVNLDLEASAYLTEIVDPGCPLQGVVFYQSCISAVVTKHQPLWSKAMRQGRMRFLDSLTSDDDRDVFKAAGLADVPPTRDVVMWWDGISAHARLLADTARMDQAREAELLTIEHETARMTKLGINASPVWKGLDDNWAGYDVLAFDLGEFGLVNKMIEVKSTTVTPLKFIVTRNEWEQAKKFGPAYIFHIWDMSKMPPDLHVRTQAEIALHIPSDNEKGRWSQTEVPVGGAK
ncbi:DUF3883 domain-containing protein [Candidatus Phyllobacterium onerii]|uniref:DUF3883 domain-containing protein n=1 Tax=Candidatus Phyllobacterium onerii TaxID=3020828 RepID=UPI00232CD3DC|nr:DUF3883 domain-containing protein [Phyllobacterium sp. IY22]